MTQATATTPRTVFFVSDGFGFQPRVYAKTGSNKRTYADVPVFRSGSFNDSMGMRNTWTDLHIRQMMDNYSYLKDKNILQSVPARDGHPSFLVSGIQGKGNVVGWHEDVKTKVLKSPVDGQEYDYLLVDYTITEDYAQQRIDSGTWRNRSAEIGYYSTNDEAEFYPVYMGFAFVDFPAVEGLNFSMSQGTKLYVMCDGFKEKTSVAENNQTGGTAQLPFPVGGTPQYGAPQNNGTQGGQPGFQFTVNGQSTTDPSAVQLHINRLEQFAQETREGARKAFVASLVQSNRVPAPQQANFEAFALRLDDESYGLWTQTMSASAPIAGLQPQSTGTAYSQSTGAPADASQQVPQEVRDAQDIVKMHERNHMPEAQLKSTKSYKRLVTAGLRQA